MDEFCARLHKVCYLCVHWC